jgi:hypothetical protein
MKTRPDELIKSMLGEDFFEVLEKTYDIYKPATRTVTGLDEMYIGLKIVPRAIISFLVSNLSDMKKDSIKEMVLPFVPNSKMHINKVDSDSYSGQIYVEQKKVNDFQYRSIPGVGLVLMTTFELYEVEELKEVKEKEEETFHVNKLQELIDQRLAMYALVDKVVNEKLAQRDAIDILMKEKLSQALKNTRKKVKTRKKTKKEEPKKLGRKRKVTKGQIAFIVKMKDKDLSWEQIAEKFNQKYGESKNTETVKKYYQRYKDITSEKTEEKSVESGESSQIEKAEYINCPDCGGTLYDGGSHLNLCICYGEDWDKQISIQKRENSIKMFFPKDIDKDNIQMLLKTLRQINKG